MNMAIDGKKLTASQEDYLEAIWTLIWNEGIARVRDIAKWLGVSTASVSEAMKTLADRKLVEHAPYKYVTLSDRGMMVAEKISARHKMLRKFLADVLNIKDEIANSNACRIEHAVDEVVSRRLRCFVEFLSQNAEASQLVEKFNDFCDRQERTTGNSPCGRKGSHATLADIKPGQKAKIVRIDGSAAIGQRLGGAGIRPGSVVSVIRAALLGDPIEIAVDGNSLAVRKAEAIDVEVEKLE